MQHTEAEELRRRGNAELAKHNVDGAVEAYRRAVELGGPERHLALSNLSTALVKAGKPDQALEAALLCVDAVGPRGGFPKAHVRMAAALHALGRVGEASKQLAMALKQCNSEAEKRDVLRVARQLKGERRPSGPEDAPPSPPAKSRASAGEPGEFEEMMRQARADLAAAQAEVARAQAQQGAALARVEQAKSDFGAEELEELEAHEAALKRASEALGKEAAKAASTEEGPASPGTVVGASGSTLDLRDAPPPAAELGTGKVLVECRVVEDAGPSQALLARWEWMGSGSGPVGGDYLALYRIDELDADEYWNMEADVAAQGRSGSASMRCPGPDGVYEFRYVTDQGRRCAGRSQPVLVCAGRAALEAPSFVLLKEPNLLIYWLYIPLAGARNGARVDISGTTLPAKVMTPTPDPRIPTLTIEKDKRQLRVLAPRKWPAMRGMRGDSADDPTQDRHLVPFLDVRLDEEVDLDRSTLSLHGGDFLAARLAFANAFSAAIARRERRTMHPGPDELDPAAFAQGVECKACGAALTSAVHRVNQAPFTPWAEMLEHLTCVPPEDYCCDGTMRAFQGDGVRPAPGVGLMDEAFVEFDAADTCAGALRLCVELAHNESRPDSASVQSDTVLRHVECARCGVWVGQVEEDRSGAEVVDLVALGPLGEESLCGRAEPGRGSVTACRLYKHCVRSCARPGLFEGYDTTGTLIGSQVARLADVREVRTVVVFARSAKDAAPAVGLQISLWTSDSWLRTEQMDVMVPVLKVTYKRASAERAEQNGAVAVTRAQLERLEADLEASSAALPPSARVFEDCKVGFLRW